MPQLSSSTGSRSVTVIRRPSQAVLASIALAAAQMARADGSADAVEQQALLRFLRQHDLLQHFGRRACLAAYRRELARDETEDDKPATADTQPSEMAAPLIASAAASIAMADGTVHPAELNLLGQLAERLNVLGEADAVASLLFRPQ